jgi:hypothetical protein
MVTTMKIGTEFIENGIEYVMGSFGLKIKKSLIQEAIEREATYQQYVKVNYGVNDNGN